MPVLPGDRALAPAATIQRQGGAAVTGRDLKGLAAVVGLIWLLWLAGPYAGALCAAWLVLEHGWRCWTRSAFEAGRRAGRLELEQSWQAQRASAEAAAQRARSEAGKPAHSAKGVKVNDRSNPPI